MNKDNLLKAIKDLNIWKKNDQRAPHKPLLILYALGQLQNNQKQWLDYHIVSEELKKLLIDFGPYRKSYHPEQPFVRLVNDGLWQIKKDDSSSDSFPARSEIKDNWLKKYDASGGFNDDVYNILSSNHNLLREVAETLLDMHFPESIHEDILSAVGLDISYTTSKRSKRDPAFRERILIAYGYSCAVCGFNVRLGQKLVGVEAAHIKWHQAGGPDIETNGIALCSMHHKLYDHGVFTINTDHRLIVSKNAHGSSGLEDWLLRYHREQINRPIEVSYMPHLEFLDWNVREVFKGEGRF